MTLNENDNKITDRAWNRLYNRLEQDGLLIDTIPEKVSVRPTIIKWSIAAAVVCICVISAFIIRGQRVVPNNMLTIQNEKDAPTLVSTLEDGSVIYLSEYTSVRYPYHFSKDKREVTLQGNAFFDISRNPDKPFIIDTKQMIIEVLGTSFNVMSKDDESFSLSVRHGEVKVTSKMDGKTVNVKDGETALFHSNDLQKIKTVDINQFKSYLKRVHFKDQRLADVVKIINANSDSIRLKIVPELEDRLLTVTFSDDTPYTMAQLICLALNLQYTQQQNTIFISQK
ncbi:MAG: FecR family protein [Prevotella sp.]|jgi:ferric-dicitrate binding protein FerR (iron transport regulator)|nr:FecR family protein [Prevotella sp.]